MGEVCFLGGEGHSVMIGKKTSPCLAALVLMCLVQLGGCADTRLRSEGAGPAIEAEGSALGERVAEVALRMRGAPYVYGGSAPGGFDCSGLVYYAYKEVGLRVARTTREQLSAAKRIHTTAMRPGDLLFFRLSAEKVSHVGIYTGANRFVHAPSTGKRVSDGSLSNPFWRERLILIGRLH